MVLWRTVFCCQWEEAITDGPSMPSIHVPGPQQDSLVLSLNAGYYKVEMTTFD